jgi:RIO kinase 1
VYPSSETSHDDSPGSAGYGSLSSALDQYDDADEDGSTRSARRPRRSEFTAPEPGRRRHRADSDPAANLALDPNWLPGAEPDRPDVGDRWSTFHAAQRGAKGPEPWPDWLVTERAAVDTDLGILKTGKEADVFLLERAVPGTDRSCILAVKRYRDLDHSQFTRDASYLAGRRVRASRDQRAMDHKTSFGRQLLGTQWASAEWGYLRQLYSAGAPVPYPVQLEGAELMMEYIVGPDGEAAPRLAQTRPGRAQLVDLWDQLRGTMLIIAEQGWAHGDLSAFNLLVAGDRLVLIDLPQVIDVVANPDGATFLARDVHNVCTWFAAQGLDDIDEPSMVSELLTAAGMR